jgi:dTDP-glucose 4,6-dehydratase
MKRILLFGGSGFIGKSLEKKLQHKYDIKMMVHNSTINTKNSIFIGNMLDQKSFSKEIIDDDIIINLVGQVTDTISNLLNLNILGGLNLLNSCLNKKIQNIIFTSTINVYGENMIRPSKETDPCKPQTDYGRIKMLTENLYRYFADTYGINITILRLAGLYGPTKKTGFLAQVINSLKNGTQPPKSYNYGKQLRDLLYIDDATDGIVKAIEHPQNRFNVFNISSGQRYMIKEIVSSIEKISGKNLNVEYSSEKVDEECIWADNSKAKQVLGFNPITSIEKGLENTIKNLIHD